MKRVARTGRIALASSLFLTACLPTANDYIKAITTLQTPLINSTPIPKFTATFIPDLTIEISSTTTLIPTDQFTPIPSFTPTVRQGIEIPTIAPTLFSSDLGPPSIDTSTPVESVSIDKLPSNTMYKPVHIQNLSGKQVDLTFQCTTNKGLETIFEYNNIKNLFTNLPEGNYVYIFFVGGKQMVGSFSFIAAPKLFITIYKDRVAVH